MLNCIILAAGKGTRMNSSLPKVMHKVCGMPMFEIVFQTAKSLKPEKITIVSSIENNKKIDLTTGAKSILQQERLGTGHAVLTALPEVPKNGKTLILYADTPLIKAETLDKMLIEEADVLVLGFNGKPLQKYGRLLTKGNNVSKIVEFKDASPKELEINLYNSGIFLVKSSVLNQLIPLIENKNKSGEYYLTDVIELANKQKLSCKFILCEEQEVMGVNTMEELSRCEEITQNELRKKHMLAGVTLIDPKSVFFKFDTIVSNNVLIEPNIFFGKGVKIEQNCVIKAFSYIEECVIKEGVNIGPFARIRGQTIIEENCKIGNFVEVKNSHLKSGVKAGHLAYIGDAEIGTETNIGAGAIFCNYDGLRKHKTTIGERVFVGSNTSIIAPLTVENNATLAAGSVITKNVLTDELAIERGIQKNIPNFSSKKKKKSVD